MRLESVYIYFVLLFVTNQTLSSLSTPSPCPPSSFFYLHFSFTLSHPLPLNQNTPLCGPSLPVPSIPPSLPPSPSSLLQVVKWILLSQSHQGKRRKRKRTEPKVNSKEVGDANLYHWPRAPSLFSTSYSWISTFCGVFSFFFHIWLCLGGCNFGAEQHFVCQSTQLSPVLFTCCA